MWGPSNQLLDPLTHTHAYTHAHICIDTSDSWLLISLALEKNWLEGALSQTLFFFFVCLLLFFSCFGTMSAVETEISSHDHFLSLVRIFPSDSDISFLSRACFGLCWTMGRGIKEMRVKPFVLQTHAWAREISVLMKWWFQGQWPWYEA